MSENMFTELSRVIEQVGKDKGIDRALVIDAVTQGMLVAARKKYGTYREIEASYNEESGEIELYEFKEVVEREKFIDEEVEIPYDEALKLDPQAQLRKQRSKSFCKKFAMRSGTLFLQNSSLVKAKSHRVSPAEWKEALLWLT